MTGGIVNGEYVNICIMNRYIISDCSEKYETYKQVLNHAKITPLTKIIKKQIYFKRNIQKEMI
jgi:hypothetical protein